MKTLVILNIGLETTAQTRVDIHHALGAIAACGVSITTSAVVNGQWEGKTEPCLFIQGFVTDPFAVGFRAQLYLASRLLSQHCIAIYHDGRGELIGDNPEGWSFDESLFHFHPVPRIPVEAPLSECQAIQKETAEELAKVFPDGEGDEILSASPIVNGWTLDGFKSYLENQIIPDSEESGHDEYAEDLHTALDFLKVLSR